MAGDSILERVQLADGKEMVLLRWEQHVEIRIDDRPLMSTHDSTSERALGELVAARLEGLPAPRILIGGLGFGFTVRAALDALPGDARVVVAELVPAVVRWNRGEYGTYARRPLDDPRVEVLTEDVAAVIARDKHAYDAIVLDIDNGPDALVHAGNAEIYKRAGLERTRAALKGPGVLAVWSAFPSKTFTKWLRDLGFEVTVERIKSADPRGPRYYIWMAQLA